MKRFFSILIILSLLAGFITVPSFATVEGETVEVSADGPVYYYNDFTKDDPAAFNKAESGNVGTTDTENGIFKYGLGVYKLNNATTSLVTGTSNVKTKCYVVVNNDENGVKPDVCVEFKVKINNLTGTYFSSSSRMFYGNTAYGVDSIIFTSKNILPDQSVTSSSKGTPILSSTNFNGTEHIVTIIYSADENTRTICIDGVNYGTFDNTVSGTYAWCDNTNGQFHCAFQLNKKYENAIELDYIKVFKYTDSVTADVKSEDDLESATAKFSFAIDPDTLKKENVSLVSEDGTHEVTVTDITKKSITDYSFTLSEKLKYDTKYNVTVSGVKDIMNNNLTGDMSFTTRKERLVLEDILLSGSDNVTSGDKTIDIKYVNETSFDFTGKLVYAQYKADGSLISVKDTDTVTLSKQTDIETVFSVNATIDASCDKLFVYILNEDGTDYSKAYTLYKSKEKESFSFTQPLNLTTHSSDYIIDAVTGELTITVEADDDTAVTLTAKKGNNTVYFNRLNTSDKKAEFKFTPSEDGTTYTYEYSVNGSLEKGNGEIVYYTPTYIANQFEIFNTTEDTTVLNGFFEKFEVLLGIDLDTYNSYSSETDKEKVLKSLIEQRKLIDPDKKYADIDGVNDALAISYDLVDLKNGKKTIENLESYFDADTFTFYKESMTEGVKGHIYSAIKSSEILTIPVLNTLLKDTMIFKAIEKGENYKLVPTVIKKYYSYIGIDLTNYSALLNPDAVDVAVYGKLYADFTALKGAFDTAVSNQQAAETTPILPPPTVVTGGGGGGGSSPIGFSKPSETEEEETPKYDEKPKSYFNDIGGFSWAKDAIGKLASIGVVNGKADGVYAPSDTVTRAELVKMVISAFGIPNGTDVKEFNDVKTDDWYFGYVNSAFENGILKGIDENTFSPNGFVTREMAATVLYRVCNFKGISLDANQKTFLDSASISSYAKEAVETLAGNSYINGYEDLTFKPQGNVTRAEIAVLINNLLK